MFKATLIASDIEIRGCEEKHSDKSGRDYLLVRFDDETGFVSDVVDKDLSRKAFYKRGTTGDLYIKINVGKFTTLEVKDFKIRE